MTTAAPQDTTLPIEPGPGAIASVLVPEPLDTGVLRFGSITYPWPTVYGGQLIAQAVVAAGRFAPAHHPWSIHASFVRPAFPDRPLDAVLTDRHRRRDGSEVLSLRIEQDRTVVFLADAAVGPPPEPSMPRPGVGSGPADSPAERYRTGPGVGDDPAGSGGRMVAPAGGGADDLVPDDRWDGLLEVHAASDEPAEATGWIRAIGPFGTDPVSATAVLAFTTDVLATDPVMRLQPEAPQGPPWNLDEWVSASLDHHVWFHRTTTADAWHHTTLRCPGTASSRGLVMGTVTDDHGSPIASIAQEHLVRRRHSTPSNR